MPAPILHRDLWSTVGHLVHTIATQGRLVLIFPTDLLVYRSAIYPQWKTFKYGLGGRLGQAAVIFSHTLQFSPHKQVPLDGLAFSLKMAENMMINEILNW